MVVSEQMQKAVHKKKNEFPAYRMTVFLRLFLNPDPRLESVFSLFAMSSSYAEDVIDRRNEQAGVREVFADDEDALKKAACVISDILNAPELAPLSKEETQQILMSIQQLHGEAYGWIPSVSEKTLYAATEAGGYLLRTKIRAAIEFLDQLYLYGEAGEVKITALGEETLEEDVPELGEI